MKKNFITSLSVIAIMILGVVFWRPGITPAQTGEPLQALNTLTIHLSAQNNSGEEGSVVLTDLGGGQTWVVVRLADFPQNVEQPAQISAGSCVKLGDVKYSLTPVLNGTAQTTLDVPFNEVITSLPLAASVHKSKTNYNTLVSCGDLATLEE